jgi:hypothetical protein
MVEMILFKNLAFESLVRFLLQDCDNIIQELQLERQTFNNNITKSKFKGVLPNFPKSLESKYFTQIMRLRI